MIEGEMITMRLEGEQDPPRNVTLVARCQGFVARLRWLLSLRGGSCRLKRGVWSQSSSCAPNHLC